ncbi:MAG: polysaccharide biosynthesis C-terminal domain-containing protein [Candidatus Promineifilaceae bacterium]
MSSSRRLFSNTALAFTANIVVKIGNSLLFILIGRLLGPSDAGIFNLGVTYLTITLALSDWGLLELMIREVAPRREESGRYLINYLVMRLLLAVAAYIVLLALLRFLLPYQPQTKLIIRVLALAVFSEATFVLCQSLFIAHERLMTPTAAAAVNSGFKLIVGFWLLSQHSSVEMIVWVVPAGSFLSLLVFIPGLFRLFRRTPQKLASRLDLAFSLDQLRYTPGFIIISLFQTLDFQLDTFLISLILTEADIGLYGAAQTIVLGFWMMAAAIRTTLYPLMARALKENPEQLPIIYRRAHQYLLLAVLPIATGITLLARPIVHLVYGDAFGETIPTLQIMIWAVVFAFINVPNARLILVYNRQQTAGWMTGISMLVNVILNLWLIPRYGIAGAAVARTAATAVLFFQLYGYAQLSIHMENVLPLFTRPFLATLIMAAVVWPIRHLPLLWPIIAGIIVYGTAAYFLKAIPEEARRRLWQLPLLRAR